MPVGRIGVRLGAALLLALLAVSAPRARPAAAGGIVGGGFPESCDETALAGALAGGGTVTFNCGTAPLTIVLSARIRLSGSVVVDGDGLVTLSGGGTTGLFEVAPGATLELRQISLTGGSDPQGNGGAIANAGTLRLDRTTLSGNRAYAGGGVYNAGGVVEVSESLLEANEAGIGGGGGIFNEGGTLRVERSTLAANTSGLHGGGIFSRGGALAISNSTISGNRAAVRGGGLYHAGPADVSWTTFAANTALFDEGGSIYSSGALTWGSSIFSGGLPHNCAGLGVYTSHGHSVSSDGTCTSGMAGDRGNLPARLGPFQNNGGATPTYALQAGSPAIDVGDPATCPATDQRGVTRPIDGNGDGLPTCDAGAFEAPPNTPPAAPGPPALSDDSFTPNRGVFRLIWTPAGDPEGDPLTYTLLHRESGDAAYSVVATGITGTDWSFTADAPEAPGVWTYVVRASDGAAVADSPPSAPVTVTTGPLGTTIQLDHRRPRPPER